MKKITTTIFTLLAIGAINAQTIESPSKHLKVNFELTANGQPSYSVTYKGKEIVKPSTLGFVLKEAEALENGFTVTNYTTKSVNDAWQPVLGEYKEIKDIHNEGTFQLTQISTNRNVNVTFRVFDEGVAFRYEFPKQQNLNYFVVKEEKTQFNLTGDHQTFWLPGDFDTQEYTYIESKISGIDHSKIDMNNGIGVKSIGKPNSVQTPLQMKTSDNIYLNIFEAAVVNYPVMHLEFDKNTYQFKSHSANNAIGDMAYLQAPFNTPWRTIMVSDDARDIVGKGPQMILNLNEPSKIEDTSWIKPMKYVGIWWEMHVGISTWDRQRTQNAQNQVGQEAIKFPHGATTENTKRYIDFAAKHGFDGVLVEGWNEGWEDWYGNWKEDVFDFTTPYADFDIKEISAYAKAKGVKMIMHHETSGSVANYERRFDRAMEVMKQYEYPAVKTGYVGRIIPRGEFHDGQTMVNHFNWTVERFAENKILVNTHESSRPSGYHRTYPNYIAAEATRGNEFNAWSYGNPPAHETILPFTRSLGGPIDYTPGIFETDMKVYNVGRDTKVHTTLAKQLALYVTLYSPLQMAADLPENYEKYADAFQFIKDVALDWDDTKYLEAEPGDYLTVARKANGSENWFIGAITDENPRQTEIKLDFLTPGVTYEATIYQDVKNAHWDKNPKAYDIKKLKVNSKSKLKLNLAASGGTAISIFPIK